MINIYIINFYFLEEKTVINKTRKTLKLTTLEQAEDKNKTPHTTRTLTRNHTTAHFTKKKANTEEEKSEKNDKILNASITKPKKANDDSVTKAIPETSIK